MSMYFVSRNFNVLSFEKTQTIQGTITAKEREILQNIVKFFYIFNNILSPFTTSN